MSFDDFKKPKGLEIAIGLICYHRLVSKLTVAWWIKWDVGFRIKLGGWVPPRGLASLMPWDAWRARKPDDFVATGFFRDVRRLSTHLFRFPHPQQNRTQLHGVFFFLKDEQLVIFKGVMETFHLKIGIGKQNSVGNPKANNEVFFGTRARGFTGAVVFRIAGNNGSADFWS